MFDVIIIKIKEIFNLVNIYQATYDDGIYKVYLMAYCLEVVR